MRRSNDTFDPNDARRSRPRLPRRAALVLVGLASVAALGGGAGGCDSPLDDMNMQNQPRYEPGDPSDFFADGRADRLQVPGTLAQGKLVSDENRLLNTGKDADGKPAAAYPFEITKGDLERGKLRYEIYCSVCHNATGDGRGMIVQRGFVPPPSFHEQRLRAAAPGHYYDVITNGWGAMYSYNDRISVEDRWRIAAYVKVLQLSQAAQVGTLPADDQEQIRSARPMSLGSTASQQVDPEYGAKPATTTPTGTPNPNSAPNPARP